MYLFLGSFETIGIQLNSFYRFSFVLSVNIEVLMKEILHVTYSKYIKELSMSVTGVNRELLHRLILYFTYS